MIEFNLPVKKQKEHTHRIQWKVLRHDGSEMCTAWSEEDADDIVAAFDILADIVDDDPCRLDHHGYCQTHGWLNETPCPYGRAREIIRPLEPQT